MPTIDVYGELGPQPYPTEATTPDAFERLMTRFNIDMTFVAATEALRGSMSDGNAWLMAQIKDRPRFRGLCVVSPLMMEESQQQMRTYLQRELFVGAILHEGYVRRPLNSDPMRTLTKALLRYDCPLYLRISDPREINDLQELAKEYPTQHFIVLHMADEHWQMAVSLASKTVNIYLETGGIVADYDKLAEAVELMGGYRLLFGAGMPLISPAYALGLIRDSATPAMEKDRILSRNAKKVFKLP
ncbi:MAG: Amidohydrolase [bacterium ADurb.Bin429]|nr:MAG: Amidohydrolase [bacterium ADurb.Bin429]